ncbi:phosphoribosylamine--glycine ligase, partial [Paenibacillus polymyxa]|nr:phosphoribosylamine--glycine ligase [Paenibacillus polymyxa]
GDLSEALVAACEQRLHKIKLEWSDKSAVAVVLAAQNYPQHPKKGNYISGLDKAGDIAKVFHAGTRETEEGIVTCGGRV